MDKHKINYIFSEKEDINEVFIKVLKKELRKYIEMICNSKKNGLTSCPNSSLEEVKIVE